MAFLHPTFLWALLALAVPILIHLFQLRRFKRIDFPNVRFLQQVSTRTRQQRKVRHWLVLLARCAALAALVLAFAQPYLTGEVTRLQTGQRAVSLYIDDSYSMDGTNADGRLLDQARGAAQQAIMTYGASDRFQVITGGMEGRQQLLTGREEALEAASRAAASPFSRPLSKVLLRQLEAVAASPAPVKRAIVFSDLQRTTTDVDAWPADSTVPVTIVPFTPTTPDNLSIDSVWFDSPVRRIGQAEALHVRVRNHGTTDLESVPLALMIDGRQRALATTYAPDGGYADTVLRFTNDSPGTHWGEVAITDRPVTFDDRLSIAYTTTDHLRVLLVSGGDESSDGRIAAVFANDSAYRFAQQDQRAFDPSALNRADLVILNALPNVTGGIANAVAGFVEEGGSCAWFPAAQQESAAALFTALDLPAPGARDTAAVKLDRMDLAHPFFHDAFTTLPRNVDLPVVRARYALRPPAGSDVLFRSQDGGAWLFAARHGRGTAYACASPLGAAGGDFTAHSAFVTTLLRMAELSRPMGALYHTIGDGTAIPIDQGALTTEAAPHLIGPGGIDVVPELRRTASGTALVLHDLALPAGAYAVVLGTDTVTRLALNLDRSESELACFTPEELRERIAQRGLRHVRVLDRAGDDLSVRLERMDKGVKLWKWFAMLALLFLIVETLLIRRKP